MTDMTWKRTRKGTAPKARQFGVRLYEDQLTFFFWKWWLDISLLNRKVRR